MVNCLGSVFMVGKSRLCFAQRNGKQAALKRNKLCVEAVADQFPTVKTWISKFTI